MVWDAGNKQAVSYYTTETFEFFVVFVVSFNYWNFDSDCNELVYGWRYSLPAPATILSMLDASPETWKVFSISSLFSYIIFSVLKFSLSRYFLSLPEFILSCFIFI